MKLQRSLITASIALAGLTIAGTSFAQQTTIKGAEKAPLPSSQNLSDWPCVQGKVENLSVAQFWDGPPIPEKKGWKRDDELQDLVRTLASRRVKLEDAEAAIKRFAEAQAEDARDKRLTDLFVMLFETVNRQRRSIISGIGKYQRAQRERAKEIETQGAAIVVLEQKAAKDEAAAKELEVAQEKFQWASRIFQERQTNIPLACELPILIDERLFALSRSIRGLMES
jgi:hypothetical protein